MSNVEENYLDNLLKNVMEPHPVQPREREQTEVTEEKSEDSTIEMMTEELSLEEMAEPIEAEEADSNLDELMTAVAEEPVMEETMPEEPVEDAVVEEPVMEETMPEEPVEDAVAEEPIIEEAILEEPKVEETIMEELTMDEPKVEVPDLESAEFSLDELDLDSLMADIPELSQPSSSEDSIDLAALEEMLGTDSVEGVLESQPDLRTEESASEELIAEGTEDDISDVLSLLGDDDSDLAEINDLLKKSDNKEPVQDDMMDLLNQMADDEEKQFDEARELNPEPEPEKSAINVEKASGEIKPERKKKEKTAKKQRVDSEGNPIEKKQGLFARLFNTLTEEFEPEPTEEELAKAAEEKAAAKQEAKAKKEEEKKAKEEENKVKAEEKEAAKKAKAEAAAQQKKEKQEAKAAKKAAKLAKEEAERPKNQKRVSPKKMILVTILAASVLAVVLLFTNFISKEGSLQRARKAYYNGNYQTVYVELYGSELEESDAIVQAKSKVILKIQRKYDSYVNHMKMGQDVKALNALIEGIATYDSINLEAEQYGVMSEVDEIKTNIVNVLDTKYGIDEATARELFQNEDEVSYTKALNNIIKGQGSDLIPVI